jgi:hypothetical protein
MTDNKTTKKHRLGKKGSNLHKINLDTKNVIKNDITTNNKYLVNINKYIEEQNAKYLQFIKEQNAKFIQTMQEKYLADKARNEYLERMKQRQQTAKTAKTTQKRKRSSKSSNKNKSSSKNKKKTDIRFLLN